VNGKNGESGAKLATYDLTSRTILGVQPELHRDDSLDAFSYPRPPPTLCFKAEENEIMDIMILYGVLFLAFTIGIIMP